MFVSVCVRTRWCVCKHPKAVVDFTRKDNSSLSSLKRLQSTYLVTVEVHLVKTLNCPYNLNWRDSVVIRATASQSVDLGFIPLVESYQKTLKNGIYNFPAWRSAFMGGCEEQSVKFACCVLGQST